MNEVYVSTPLSLFSKIFVNEIKNQHAISAQKYRLLDNPVSERSQC
jgi:hypothetical protein